MCFYDKNLRTALDRRSVEETPTLTKSRLIGFLWTLRQCPRSGLVEDQDEFGNLSRSRRTAGRDTGARRCDRERPGSWFRISSLLVFPGLGMLVADDGLALVRFDEAALAQNSTTVALVVIPYEGGLGSEPASGTRHTSSSCSSEPVWW